jgi:hypothetical protein
MPHLHRGELKIRFTQAGQTKFIKGAKRNMRPLRKLPLRPLRETFHPCFFPFRPPRLAQERFMEYELTSVNYPIFITEISEVIHNPMKKNLLIFAILVAALSNLQGQSPKAILLTNVTVIDGSGRPAQKNVNVLIEEGKIVSLRDDAHRSPQLYKSDPRVIDLSGKTIIPLLINVHGHLGMSKGTTIGPENFSREQIAKELRRYQTYGVGTVVSMGMDKELIFSIREDSRSGKLPGAVVYTAGYGFRSPLGTRPQETGMEKIYRPTTPDEAIANVKELVQFKPDMIKMWVDDQGGTVEKIKPAVYRAIINEAHKYGIRVAAHLFYLEDAHALLDAGVDLFAHSVRDKEVDDAFKRHRVHSNPDPGCVRIYLWDNPTLD